MRNLAFLIVLTLGFTVLNSQILSDFESGDTDSWRSEGDGNYLWESGTGNPGDCLRINDYATGAMNYAIAPLKFTGDWSNATSTDSIYFDLKVITSAGYVSSQWTFEISGPGGMARLTPSSPNPPLNIWTYYTAELDSTLWNIISGDWNSILQDIDLLRIRAEYISGDEYVLMDNVSISFNPVILPVLPVVITDYENGAYDGWYFEDAGSTSIVTSDGNPGKYCRINDQAGVLSQGIAPPKFLGDWTLLEDNAAFMIDVRTNQSFADGVGFFIKITGPGGEAIIPIDPGLADAFNQWKTFSYMISESAWIVNSGTWNALLQNVEEIRITLEYTDNSDIIDIDNVRISNNPPIANFTSDTQYSCLGGSVQFFDSSSNAPTSWDWDFGDGFTSSEQNPIHLYQNPGMYDVQLSTTNIFGSDTILKENFIELADSNNLNLFSDNFDDNIIHSAWEFINGTWTETNGEIRQSSNYYNTGWANGCFALTGCPSFLDYEIEVDFKSSDNDGIGAIINFEDENNFYLFVWRKETNYRGILKYVNGVETELASDGVTYTSNIWYNLKFKNNQGSIICQIDDTEIFNVTDTSLTMGKAGLYCWANQSSYWDNLSITNIGYIPEPQNVTITENVGIIELNWDSVPNATSYSVYSSTDYDSDPVTWTLEQSEITVTNWSETATVEKKFYFVKAMR